MPTLRRPAGHPLAIALAGFATTAMLAWLDAGTTIA